jgi:hypothetical protein
MKNLICYLLLGLSFILFVACFPGKFIVDKYNPAKPTTGFVYALPKTLLNIDIPYTLTYKEQYCDNGYYEKKVSAKLGEIKVEPMQIPDPKHRYEIETDIWNSVTWQNNFLINLTEENYLSSSGITFHDGTLSFVKGLTDLLLPIIKPAIKPLDQDISKKAKKEIDRLEAAFKSNRQRILGLLETAAYSSLSKDQLLAIKTKLDVLLANEKVLSERIASLKTLNVKKSNIKITCVIDPEKPDNNKNDVYTIIINESNCSALKQIIDSFKNASVKIPEDFICEYWLGIKSEEPLPASAAVKLPTGAYLYRIPFDGNFEIRKNDMNGEVLAEGMLQVNQFGQIGQIKVKPKIFAKKELTVELHTKTGGLKKMEVKTEGFAAESFVTTAQGIVTKIEEELKEETELEKLQAENQLLQARIDKIKKEQELEDIKSKEE